MLWERAELGVQPTVPYRIFWCISQLFNTKNSLPKIVLDLYMDQNMKFFKHPLKLYKTFKTSIYTIRDDPPQMVVENPGK